jgi:hypothetical protein
MKAVDWKRAVRLSLPADADWEFRGTLCYRLPVKRLLLGVLGEGSAFDTGVYVWRVTMPLFVPSDHVVLSWSERIGGGACKYDKLDVDGLAAAVSSAVGELGEEEALDRIIASDDPSTPNRRLHEVIGYVRLLLGDLTSAQESLARAEAGMARASWERSIIDRVQLISRVLDEQGRDGAVEQLDSWCDKTAGALGLRRPLRGSRS